jgi:hypothetical protein
MLVFAIAGLQLNRFAVWGVQVGFRPRLFALAHLFPISEPLLDNKPFQRRGPMLIILRSIIRLAAIFSGLQLAGQRGGLFLPCENVPAGESLTASAKACASQGSANTGPPASPTSRARAANCSPPSPTSGRLKTVIPHLNVDGILKRRLLAP